VRRSAVALALVVLVGPMARVSAQSLPPLGESSSSTGFLTRTDFSFLWAHFFTPDPRFAWNAVLGVDLDLVDYGAGRIRFAAEYEGVLGSERRLFDLNHENFMLEGGGSYRLGSTEVSGFFHHVSRHLTDRANASVSAWNVADARATRRFKAGTSTIEGTLAAGRVLQRNFVDYTWTSELRLAIWRPVTPAASLFARGVGRLVGVDRARLDRDRQCGARVEFGLRLNGVAGAAEIVAGYERRIDGFPTDRYRVRAFTIGFRLTSR
jgi:hypothetical protein